MSTNGHKTQITVAAIGLIGVLGAALLGNWDRLFPQRRGDEGTQKAGPSPTPVAPGPGGQASQGSAFSGCVKEYFAPVARDRVAALEAGAKDRPLIQAHQPKDQAVGIQLEDNGRPVGAVTLRFYQNNQLFKIESVVDSACRRIEDYANATRGGDKHILQNWDDLQIRLGNAEYTLSVDYGAGRIEADFVRISPGP